LGGGFANGQNPPLPAPNAPADGGTDFQIKKAATAGGATKFRRR
jgi:hypothetical protein